MESSTTISKESTLQAIGDGSGEHLVLDKMVIWSDLYGDIEQFTRERIWRSEPYGT